MLVVCLDDNPAVLEALTLVLARRVEVVSCSTVDAAMACVRERRPHAVITDFDVGEQRNGLWVLAEVARVAPDARRILLTGSSIDDVADLDITFAQSVLRKPAAHDELFEALGLSTRSAPQNAT